MTSTHSIVIGNFLYKNCYPLYKFTYQLFKKKQDVFEISLMKQYIQKGDSVLDIGANIGFYAEILSELVDKKGKVHCFEPDSTNYKHLEKRCHHLSNVFLNHKAVSDKTDKLKIYTSKQLNVDHRTYKPDDYDREIEIDAIAIDDYLSSHSKDCTVDFIKMDIQGFEMSAAKGMKKTFQSPHLKLLSEFWPYGMRKAGSSVLEYYQFLKQYNFYIYLIENQQLVELSEEKVTTFLNLPETNYMNIFASKDRV